MDYHSLAAAHLSTPAPRRRPGPDAEDRYWRGLPTLPRPQAGLVLPLVTIAGVVLILLGIAQA